MNEREQAINALEQEMDGATAEELRQLLVRLKPMLLKGA